MLRCSLCNTNTFIYFRSLREHLQTFPQRCVHVLLYADICGLDGSGDTVQQCSLNADQTLIQPMVAIYIHILQQRIPNSRKTEMPNEIQPSITLNNCIILPFFKWGRTCETHVTNRCLKYVCALICERQDSSISCVGLFEKKKKLIHKRI